MYVLKSFNGYTESVCFMVKADTGFCFPTNVVKEIEDLKSKGWEVHLTDPRK